MARIGKRNWRPVRTKQRAAGNSIKKLSTKARRGSMYFRFEAVFTDAVHPDFYFFDFSGKAFTQAVVVDHYRFGIETIHLAAADAKKRGCTKVAICEGFGSWIE